MKYALHTTIMARFRIGSVRLGRGSRRGRATTYHRAECLACGALQAANLEHLIACPSFQPLHATFRAALAEQGHFGPVTVPLIFGSSCAFLESRMQYVLCLDTELERLAAV